MATPYGDVAAFGREHAPEGLIVYLEAAGDDAATICRNLHGLRLAGWFEHAKTILIGRTKALDSERLSQRAAVLDALGRLDLPIVFDLEIGHVRHTCPWSTGRLRGSPSTRALARSCSGSADEQPSAPPAPANARQRCLPCYRNDDHPHAR